MIAPDLSRRRLQLGLAVRWVTAGARGFWEEGDGYWCALSGVASPDVNSAVVHTDDPQALRRALAAVQAADCPATLLLAGPAGALSAELGGGWSPAGSAPVMAVDLTETERQPDGRVRAATTADVEELSALLSAAFGFDVETAGVALQPIRTGDARCTVYTLVEAGAMVSTLVASRVEDTVSLWCMATPPQHARRGYGRALLSDVLARAAADGAAVGLLGATPAGLPLYQATGWQMLEHWAMYVNAPSAQFPTADH